MNPEQVRDALSYLELGFSGSAIARRMQVERWALRYAVGGFRKRTVISDDDLDDVVRAMTGQNPHAGSRFIAARLRTSGIFVARERVRNSIHRVDANGRVLRRSRVLRRRIYHAPHFNFVWHVDGYHKLIR
jgi:hypothetical protein